MADEILTIRTPQGKGLRKAIALAESIADPDDWMTDIQVVNRGMFMEVNLVTQEHIGDEDKDRVTAIATVSIDGEVVAVPALEKVKA